MPNGIYTSFATGKEMRSVGFVLSAKSERGEAGDEAVGTASYGSFVRLG